VLAAAATALTIVIATARVHAQAPNLAGTWTLDAGLAGATGSPGPTGAPGRGRGNFAGFSTATRLVIVQSPTEVRIETNTGTEGQAQTAVYKLDGSANTVPGPIGWDTKAVASVADGKLVVKVTRVIEGPEGPIRFEITDAYSVATSGAGSVLTLERAQGARSIQLVYKQ
jgi:hypothetical protein